jgi:hypothetical protein
MHLELWECATVLGSALLSWTLPFLVFSFQWITFMGSIAGCHVTLKRWLLGMTPAELTPTSIYRWRTHDQYQSSVSRRQLNRGSVHRLSRGIATAAHCVPHYR